MLVRRVVLTSKSLKYSKELDKLKLKREHLKREHAVLNQVIMTIKACSQMKFKLLLFLDGRFE